MATTTFSGPVKAGTINNTTGTTVGTNVANTGFVLMAQSANIVFGADATTTDIATLPANSQIFQITLDITTAFDAGTTNTIDFGDGTTADKYADALAAGSLARVLARVSAPTVAMFMVVWSLVKLDIFLSPYS